MYRNRLYAPRALYGMQDWGDPSGDFPADPSQMIPRSTRISWSGVVPGDATSTEGILYLGFSPGRQGTLKKRLQNAGFSTEVVDFEFEYISWDTAYFRILLTVATPIAYARAEDAFSVLKGIVWDVYGAEPQDITNNVVNVPTIDPRTGRETYHGAGTVDDPANKDKGKQADCNWDTQTIGEYLACQLGFNSTSTATMVVIGALVLIGIVALKK